MTFRSNVIHIEIAKCFHPANTKTGIHSYHMAIYQINLQHIEPLIKYVNLLWREWKIYIIIKYIWHVHDYRSTFRCHGTGPSNLAGVVPCWMHGTHHLRA